MLCPHCGTYVSQDDVVCPGCGAAVEHIQPDEGVRAIRQGRRGRETMNAMASASVPKHAAGSRGASHAPVYDTRVEETNSVPVYNADGSQVNDASATASYDRFHPYNERDTQRQTVLPNPKNKYTHQVKAHMINWAHMAIIGSCVFVLLIIGCYFYLTRTTSGQRIMARLGQDASAEALWQVGEEEMDKGQIDKAIAHFEQAREKNGDDVNVDGLLLLGNAYEAAGRDDDAEALYTEMYTDIVPTRSEPYSNTIRIMLAQSRRPEAAALMQIAYEKTGLSTFRQQRIELLPSSPTTELVAGVYNVNKYLDLASPEGYDVYYIFNDDEAVLPDAGTLYTEPIYLDEGVYKLRAVAVNEDLVSDELSATYKVIMDAPQTPTSSLAPNTYKTRQRIWLHPGDENKNDTDITIYYTIDGSTPDADSPVYTGEPFWLPGGRVTLRAIAVNGYGKMSNTLEILYKITGVKSPLTAYSTDDTIAKLTLNSTTLSTFQDTYGSANSIVTVTYEGASGDCQKHIYDWGYAIFAPKKTDYVLVDLYFTSGRFSGPRSTNIGDTEDDIVGVFRDYGQVESPSGNRGLYTSDDNVGKIYKQTDGSKIIRYRVATTDSHMWQLDYNMSTSGVCTSIHWTFEY